MISLFLLFLTKINRPVSGYADSDGRYFGG